MKINIVESVDVNFFPAMLPSLTFLFDAEFNIVLVVGFVKCKGEINYALRQINFSLIINTDML